MRELISEKEPHDKMISERAICRKYNVSRTTVRLALVELENSGDIYKKQGVGTFVSGLSQKRLNLLDTFSFTDYTRELGKEPQTDVISFEIKPADSLAAHSLGLKEGEKIYIIKRLRLANSVSMMLETTYLPVYLFPKLKKEKVSKKPLYEIFRQDYNQRIKYADEGFTSSVTSKKDSEILKVPISSPCLQIQRTTYNQKNIIIEYTESVARSDKFMYTVRHSI